MFCLKKLEELEDMSAEWPTPWAQVRVCLAETSPAQCWFDEVQTGAIEDVVKTLQSIVVNKKAPLQGVTKKMWICASAWKATMEKLDKVTRENEKLRELSEGVIQRVHKHERRRRGKSADPKLRPKVRAFVAKLTENDDEFDPDEWDGGFNDEDQRCESGRNNIMLNGFIMYLTTHRRVA